jgi:phenolphthiocerol/phthiocerol/phthiodiolone dimycocerosyl transferase
MAPGRYLDHIEIYGLGNAGARFVSYGGQVAEDVLAEAFRSLGRQHPVLRAHVRPDAGGYSLSVASGDAPALVVIDGGEDQLSAEMAKRWDPANALCRLVLAREDNSGIIGMRIDHSIADGRSSIALLWELWDRYASLLDGGDAAPGPAEPLPVPPSLLFKEHFGDERFGGIPLAPADPRVFAERASGKSALPAQGRIRLSGQETRGVLNRARAEGLSVHGLLCGVILAEHGSRLGDSPAGLRCMTIIDFRDRVRPPVGPTATTNFDGLHEAVITAHTAADPLAAGHQVKKQIDKALTTLEFPPVAPAPPGSGDTARWGQITVSNLGVLPRLPAASTAEITGFGTISVNIGPVPLYAPYTFGDQLHVGYVYSRQLFEQAEVEDVTAAIGTQLRELARS